MKTEEIIEKLEPWLAKHRRPAWKPIVESGDGALAASKFSGTPWIGKDSPWPNCGHCKQRLQLFLQLNLSDLPGTVRLECEELGLVFDNIKDKMLAENIANSKLGDKLGGWPGWIQNVEYPNCPQCGNRMVHVFQVDSENNVPFMFGDAGCGHITQCPQHKEAVAFGWACY